MFYGCKYKDSVCQNKMESDDSAVKTEKCNYKSRNDCTVRQKENT